MCEQGHGNDLEQSVEIPRVSGKAYEQSDNADEWKKPGSFLEEGRDRKHLLLRGDDDAMKQVISSTGQQSAASQGDIPEGAAVVASFICDRLEYLDWEDLASGRHRMDGATGVGLVRQSQMEAEASRVGMGYSFNLKPEPGCTT